jgi:hypothetical protein
MIDDFSFWGVTMVRDEMDILPYTLAHFDRQGLDGIIVADNLSTDGTWEYLQEVELKTPLLVRRDTEPGYYQSRKMTDLAQDAFARGAGWVLPFDADEVWRPVPRGQDDRVLRDLVGAQRNQGADCLMVPLHNYFPRSQDNWAEVNPLKRIQHRDPSPAPLFKVIVRARADVVIEQGNHGAHGNGAFVRVPAKGLEIAHFPWRSYEQFEHKVRNGAAAYQATDLSEDIGAHWRSYGALLDTHGPGALRALYEEWFQDPAIFLEFKPVWNE